MIGEIMNAGDNGGYREDFGFTGSYFNIARTNKDDYTKNKFLNMQRGNLRPQRRIEKMTENLMKNIRKF